MIDVLLDFSSARMDATQVCGRVRVSLGHHPVPGKTWVMHGLRICLQAQRVLHVCDCDPADVDVFAGGGVR